MEETMEKFSFEKAVRSILLKEKPSYIEREFPEIIKRENTIKKLIDKNGCMLALTKTDADEIVKQFEKGGKRAIAFNRDGGYAIIEIKADDNYLEIIKIVY